MPALKPAEPTWFSLAANYVAVRTTGRTATQYYEFWDTDAGWALLAAKGYKTPEGTSSQFLKADGSIDGNLYALAYEGNQNKTQHSQYSRFTNYFNVIDRRSEAPTPNSYEAHNISAFLMQATACQTVTGGLAST